MTNRKMTEMLAEMDKTARGLNDEVLVMDWLATGIPDHLVNWEIEDYEEFVDEFDELWEAFDCLMVVAVALKENIPEYWNDYLPDWEDRAEEWKRENEGWDEE